MTRPLKWDLKTWLTLAAFFGVGSFTGLLSQAQRIIGWGAGPTIEAHQAKALAHQDSVQNVRWDSLKAWRREDKAALYSLNVKVDNVAATVADLPGGAEAARRRRVREQAARDVAGREIADRTTWRALKAEGIP